MACNTTVDKVKYSAITSSTRRCSQAVSHPSTNQALCQLTAEFRWDRVNMSQCGRWWTPGAKYNTQNDLAPSICVYFKTLPFACSHFHLLVRRLSVLGIHTTGTTCSSLHIWRHCRYPLAWIPVDLHSQPQYTCPPNYVATSPIRWITELPTNLGNCASVQSHCTNIVLNVNANVSMAWRAIPQLTKSSIVP